MSSGAPHFSCAVGGTEGKEERGGEKRLFAKGESDRVRADRKAGGRG